MSEATLEQRMRAEDSPPPGSAGASDHAPVPKKVPGELYLLNTIRWMSALLVAASHATSLVFKHHPFGHGTSLSGNATTYFSELGHPSVMIFFVISGYLVGGGVLGRLSKFDARFYAASRFARIYIALIPAIVLTVGLDTLAYFLMPTSPVYTTGWAGPISQPVFSHYTVRNAVATLLCLERIIGEPLGSNGPLWSLGYEWFFYIVFPVVLCTVHKLKILGTFGSVFAVAGVACVMVAVKQNYVAAYWVIWTLGAFAKVVADRRPVPLPVALLGSVIAVLAFMAAPVANQRMTDPVIGFGFALFLCNQAPLRASLHRRFDHALAHFSYSLYIIHLPIMAFLMLFLVSAGLFSTTAQLDWCAQGIALSLILIAFPLWVAYLFGLIFESRTDDLRRFLLRKLKPVPAAAALL